MAVLVLCESFHIFSLGDRTCPPGRSSSFIEQLPTLQRAASQQSVQGSSLSPRTRDELLADGRTHGGVYSRADR